MKEFQKRAYHRPREIPDDVWPHIVKRIQASNSREVIAAQTDEDYLDSVAKTINRPVLIFRGASDQIVSQQAAQKLGALIVGAVYREAHECGHLPQKECSAALLKALNEMVWYGVM